MGSIVLKLPVIRAEHVNVVLDDWHPEVVVCPASEQLESSVDSGLPCSPVSAIFEEADEVFNKDAICILDEDYLV